MLCWYADDAGARTILDLFKIIGLRRGRVSGYATKTCTECCINAKTYNIYVQRQVYNRIHPIPPLPPSAVTIIQRE